MEKKENIKEYLQKMLDRWNKYDELDGFVAENFRIDLEKTLEYWDLRIADDKEELEKAREEGRRKAIEELRLAFHEVFFKSGELWFDYLFEEEDIEAEQNAKEVVEGYWEELLSKLGSK